MALTSLNKRPVNLLFISDLFYPHIGGAEKSALITLTYIAKFGIKINVLTNLLDGKSNIESYNNIMIYREKLFSQQSLDFIHRFLLYVKSIPIIIKYVMVLKPNIIISQQLISTSAITVAKFFKVPIVVIIHDYWPICYYRSLLKPNRKICYSYDTCLSDIYECVKYNSDLFWLKSKNDKKAPSLFLIFLSTLILFKSLVVKKVLEKADILIAVSFYVKRKLVEGGFNKNQIKVVYNPVVVNKHDIVQSSNAHHVLFVGRLDIKKGIELLIMAMQSIREKYPRAFLTIVGDGPQKKHCERLVNQLNMESCVKFLGYVSENTLMDLYQSCSVVVVPSIWPEPFGIVVAEAILCRRPVVASNIGGIPELINKKTGILVPPGDVSALAEAITSIIENKVSIESDTIIHEKLSPCRITEHVLNVINAVTETRSDYLT